jgi:hypothetical protein
MFISLHRNVSGRMRRVRSDGVYQPLQRGKMVDKLRQLACKKNAWLFQLYTNPAQTNAYEQSTSTLKILIHKVD